MKFSVLCVSATFPKRYHTHLMSTFSVDDSSMVGRNEREGSEGEIFKKNIPIDSRIFFCSVQQLFAVQFSVQQKKGKHEGKSDNISPISSLQLTILVKRVERQQQQIPVKLTDFVSTIGGRKVV